MGYEWLGPAIQGLGGLAGEAFSAGDKQKQTQLLADLLKRISDQQVPNLSPITADLQGDSALSGYAPDPSLIGTQRDTLARLQNIDKGGGFAVEDKADLARIGNTIAEQQRAAGSGLHAALARRGALGSGEDYASQMGLAQNANQQAYQGGLDQSKLALQRKLEAMGQESKLAGDMRNQDFTEKSRQAEAQDAINQYNSRSRQAAQNYNAGLPATQYGLEMDKLRALQGATTAASAQYGQNASDTRQLWTGLGTAAAGAARGATSPHPATTGMTTQELEQEVARRKQLQQSGGAADAVWPDGSTSGYA